MKRKKTFDNISAIQITCQKQAIFYCISHCSKLKIREKKWKSGKFYFHLYAYAMHTSDAIDIEMFFTVLSNIDSI